MRSCFVSIFSLFICCATTFATESEKLSVARPNVLWISLEDISPDLGCYGDAYAKTPVIDALAKQSVRYDRAFTHAGVCAPVRSGIITGMYPASITTQHMRCDGVPANNVRCFTEYLRESGYYCTNNSKTDYQFAPPITAWDENGVNAHWRGREKDQPFFAVYNFISTHESQNRTADGRSKPTRTNISPQQRHDPAQVVLPPFWPDTPVVRKNLADYYDNIAFTERAIAKVLKELEDDGLAEDTIVWFWGDHGRGLPRYKRWLYDSGTRIPLLIRVPEKYRNHAAPQQPALVAPGTVNAELTSAIDFAPTMLSLCGLEIPKHLQGQAFLGPKKAAEPRKFVYGARDRMDERYDLIRAVRDTRYRYIRNFLPHLTYAQPIAYGELMPIMQEWRRLHGEGKLNDVQKLYFAPFKPIEELYDTQADPYEVVNLADKPEHAERLKTMRAELERWMTSIDDTGLIPEVIIEELNHPGGVKPTTPLSVLTVGETSPKGATTVELKIPNDGAVAYRIVKPGDANAKGKSGWSVLPTGGKLEVPPGHRLIARGVRLGYKDSANLEWKPGDAAPEASKPETYRGPEEVKALAKKTLPGTDVWKYVDLPLLIEAEHRAKPNAVPLYLFHSHGPLPLIDDATAMSIARHYWCSSMAYVAKRYGSDYVARYMKNTDLDFDELDDDYAVALLDVFNLATMWPGPKRLESILSKSKNEFTRLAAALVLDEAGEKARPALATIRAHVADKDNAGRVCTAIVKKLDPKNAKPAANEKLDAKVE